MLSLTHYYQLLYERGDCTDAVFDDGMAPIPGGIDTTATAETAGRNEK